MAIRGIFAALTSDERAENLLIRATLTRSAIVLFWQALMVECCCNPSCVVHRVDSNIQVRLCCGPAANEVAKLFGKLENQEKISQEQKR